MWPKKIYNRKIFNYQSTHNMNNVLKNKIAWKIYFIWLFKRIIPLFVLELVLLVLVLWIFGRLVFVQQIFNNAFLASAQNPIRLASYMLDAFAATSWLKKIVIVFFLGFGVLIMRDIGRAIVSYSTTSKITKQK